MVDAFFQSSDVQLKTLGSYFIGQRIHNGFIQNLARVMYIFCKFSNGPSDPRLFFCSKLYAIGFRLPLCRWESRL